MRRRAGSGLVMARDLRSFARLAQGLRSTDDLAWRLAMDNSAVLSALGKAWLARPFPAQARLRILLAYQASTLAAPQFYPFLRYGARFAARGIHFRAMPTEGLDPTKLPSKLDALFYQSDYRLAEGVLEESLARIKAARPDLRISYFDWFAPADIRFAARVEPWVDAYVKKCLFSDRARHIEPTQGHTNLNDYFTARYGVENPPRDWEVPEAIIPRLDLSPAFSTAPELIRLFEGDPPPESTRDIDIHARIASKGSPWYQHMREEAKAALVKNFADLRVIDSGRVSHAEFMDELHRARLCFSPFGYGEICWRDFEAIATGSVLVKPDMSHIAAEPDIYRPGETYIPVAWDLSDLNEKVRGLLADPARCRRIAEQAFAVVRDYLRGPALEQLAERLAAGRVDGDASPRA